MEIRKFLNSPDATSRRKVAELENFGAPVVDSLLTSSGRGRHMIQIGIDGVSLLAPEGDLLIDILGRPGKKVSQVCYHEQLGPGMQHVSTESTRTMIFFYCTARHRLTHRSKNA